MVNKQSWFKNLGTKLVAVKQSLEKRAEERDEKRYSSLDDNPFNIQNRNKRFSTYRSELIHGVMLKPLDKYLEREARGEGANDGGLLGGLWHFKDDEEEREQGNPDDEDKPA